MNKDETDTKTRKLIRRFALVSIVLVSVIVGRLSVDVGDFTLCQGSLPKRTAFTDKYESAQYEFRQGNYRKALKSFQLILKDQLATKGRSPMNSETQSIAKKERFYWNLSKISTIYLSYLHNPTACIQYLEKYSKSDYLSEDQQDEILEWIAAAQDWKRFGKFPKDLNGAIGLFYAGERYYKRGKEKKKYPADDSGNADFSIAQSYLMPFITHFNYHTRIGAALFMMGEIRHTLSNDQKFWIESFYFKEVIRRFPKTNLAKKAWGILRDGVHLSYSGATKDTTPDSVLEMLEVYRKLAFHGKADSANESSTIGAHK